MGKNAKENDRYARVREFYVGTREIDGLTVKKEWLPHKGRPERTFWQTVTNSKPPKATFLIVHGFGEYVGRYLRLSCDIATKNYEVHGFDFSGFGYSSGSRIFASYEHLQHDFHVVLQKLRKDIPLFIIAHSMGGGFMLSYLCRNPDFKVAGVILYCPWVQFSAHVPISEVTFFFMRKGPKELDVTLADDLH